MHRELGWLLIRKQGGEVTPLSIWRK